jgi:hypothetical protein
MLCDVRVIEITNDAMTVAFECLDLVGVGSSTSVSRQAAGRPLKFRRRRSALACFRSLGGWFRSGHAHPAFYLGER